MGKKVNLFSAIKKAFSPHSKKKLGNQEAESKGGKEKRKKGIGKLRRGGSSSFLPIFREPSSIEKILAEAERDHNLVFRPPTPDPSNPPSASPPPPLRPASPQSPPPRDDLPRLDSSKPSPASSESFVPPIVHSPRPTSPRVVSPQADPIKPPSPRIASPQAISPKPLSPSEDQLRLETPRPPSPKPHFPRPEPSILDAPRPTTPKHPSPRAELRGETASRPEPTLLVQHASATKIQAAFRGYTARRSFRALRSLVRLQGLVKGYSVKRQTVNAMKYMQKLVRVQSKIQSHRTKMLENQTQVEKDEASAGGNDNWDDSVLTKEERDARSQRKIDAIIRRQRSMAYAYSHKLGKNSPKSAHDVRTSGGLPLWWNWGDQQLPLASPVPSHYRLTPTRLSPNPLSQSSNQHHFKLVNDFDISTPKSSRSTLSRPFTSRGRLRDSPFKDDDSLTSCPPFPSYMAPTVSAKAKVRPNSNPKERVMGTPPSVSSETRRRVSYPPAQQGKDMFRWNKGSLLMSNKGPGSPVSVVLEKHKTVKSVGHLSIDSTVGRKPFNTYV